MTLKFEMQLYKYHLIRKKRNENYGLHDMQENYQVSPRSKSHNNLNEIIIKVLVSNFL